MGVGKWGACEGGVHVKMGVGEWGLGRTLQLGVVVVAGWSWGCARVA